MREQFENLPEIAKILKDEDTHWCNKRNMYVNQRVFQDSTTGYLNGAYYAFQEQQKTIVKYEAGLRKNKANKHKLLAKNIELQKKIDELTSST